MAKEIARGDKAWARPPGLKSILREEDAEYSIDLSVGHAAPQFVTQDVDGKTVRLGELRCQVVVLDIRASWCGPCKAMIPHERENGRALEGQAVPARRHQHRQ